MQHSEFRLSPCGSGTREETIHSVQARVRVGGVKRYVWILRPRTAEIWLADVLARVDDRTANRHACA